jgi:mRNA interferase MazF
VTTIGGNDGPLVWDVVRVPFPYTNRPIRQRRPALVVAVPNGTGIPGLLWVLMITSAQNRGWPGDVMVSDILTAGLPVPSTIRSAKIATIEARDAETIGTLASIDRGLVVAQMRRNLMGLKLER